MLWGIYYCIILLIEKAFLLKLLNKAPSFVSHIYSLVLVLFGWWIFVFEDLGAGVVYLSHMFGSGVVGLTTTAVTYDVVRNLLFLGILSVASTPLPRKVFYKIYEKNQVCRSVIAVAVCLTLVVCTAYLVDSSYNPFLYFRF